MSAVTDYIDAHFSSTLDRLTKWAAQPSVSAENIGVDEMAQLAADDLRASGFNVTTYPTKGHPIIVAEAGPTRRPTLLIYNHYDVQPAGDPALWTSPPFEPQVRGDKMYGRGVADTKSNIVSRLDTLDAIKAVQGELPIRVVWLLEGEEEVGSPNLDAFMREHGQPGGVLQADGCVWEFGGYTWDGTPNITIGLKGMLTVELIARAANRDLHSGLAAIVPSPVWRLIWALGAIKTPDNKIHIPDFYSPVQGPTEQHEKLLRATPDETAVDREAWGLSAYVNNMTGIDVYRASAFDPTANIQGIEAGYNGPGTKTVLPKEARARIDFRLVPDQHPDQIFESLRAFLNDKGFSDVEVRKVADEGDLLPGISDPTSPFIQKVIQACQEVSGKTPVITPSSGGSGPLAPFTQAPPNGLGIPTTAIGTGYPDSRAHSPDENIRIEDVRAHMHTMARLIELMSEE